MLKNIPSIISPDFLKILCEMGHGDTLVIGDGNFPAASVARANGAALIRCDGLGASELLRAVLALFPLDTYVDSPIGLMGVAAGTKQVAVPIWDEFHAIASECEGRGQDSFRIIERFEFYEEAKRAFAVAATSESAAYANIILQKGVVAPK